VGDERDVKKEGGGKGKRSLAEEKSYFGLKREEAVVQVLQGGIRFSQLGERGSGT